MRWIDAFGWRRLSDHERAAQYVFWREIGRRMGIVEIPSCYEALLAFNVAYEREHFRYAETNQRVGEATCDLFLSWFPRPLRPLLTPGRYALLDDPVLDAFGSPHPPRLLRSLAASGLGLRPRVAPLPGAPPPARLHRDAPPQLSAWLYDRRSRPARDDPLT